jgi:uncharacterized membrane protein
VATIEHAVEIARSPREVWAVLEDVRRLPEVSRSTLSVSDAPDRLTAPGDRFRQVVKAVGKRFESEWEVLELVPERRLVIEGSVGYGVTYRLLETLEPLDGGDRTQLGVCIDYRLPFGPLGRLAERLGVSRLAEQEAAEVAAGVRRVVEAS